MRQSYPLSPGIGGGRSLKANSKEMLNCFIEQLSNGRQVVVGRPGLTRRFVLPNSPVRGCFSDSDISYWVAGNGVYKVLQDFTIIFLGNISTSNGYVKFASSGVDLMLVDGQDGWAIKIATNVLTLITAPAFPSFPTDVKYTKGYFVVTQKDSQIFHISEKINIATVWNGLDFASAEGNPDNTAGVVIYQDEIVFAGYQSVEFWSFTGNPLFPMQRNTNVVIDHGCIAPLSIARAADQVFFLSGDQLGQGIVMAINGYTASRISTHEIEQQIAGLYLVDAFALTYQQEGHIFYILQFPSNNKTIAYDATTQMWHTLASKNPITGNFNIWNASCHCFSGSYNLVGDVQTGNVYQVNKDEYTDNGQEIVTQYTSVAQNEVESNIFYKEMIINMETGVGTNSGQGVDPKLNMQWSNDGGQTWSNWRQSSLGKIGQYNARVYFDRLGRGRSRVWRLRITDPVKRVFISAVVNADVGLS